MLDSATSQRIQLPRIRRWPIRAISLLLLLQAVGLLLISLYLFNHVEWDREWSDVALSENALEIVSFMVFFVPLATVIIFTALGFSFLWRAAWLMAMIEQGLSLFGCLAIYFTFESALNTSNFIYLIMLYSIVMVLYLNNNDVRIAFQAKSNPVGVEPTGETTAEPIDKNPLAQNSTDKNADERPGY